MQITKYFSRIKYHPQPNSPSQVNLVLTISTSTYIARFEERTGIQRSNYLKLRKPFPKVNIAPTCSVKIVHQKPRQTSAALPPPRIRIPNSRNTSPPRNPDPQQRGTPDLRKPKATTRARWTKRETPPKILSSEQLVQSVYFSSQPRQEILQNKTKINDTNATNSTHKQKQHNKLERRVLMPTPRATIQTRQTKNPGSSGVAPFQASITRWRKRGKEPTQCAISHDFRQRSKWSPQEEETN